MVAIIVAVVLIVVVAATTRTSDSKKSSSVASSKAESTTTSVLAISSNVDSSSTTVVAGLESVKTAPVPAYGDSATVPLKTEVTDTNDLTDGAPVSIHVEPEKGSFAYGFEAFQCKAGVDYITDADVRPTQTGNCLTAPVSPTSERYVAARAAPPYSSVDGVFHVGIGTNSYQMQNGKNVTITCDASHPCVLVLKLQFPNGYGFQTIPLRLK